MIVRSSRALVVALLLSVAAFPLAGEAAFAKLPDLTLVTQATYDVVPDEGRVAVTVRITATNRLRDTVARRFFFRTAYLAVPPGTSKFSISAASGTPAVSVRRRARDHTLLRIDLGANLAAGRSRNLTLRFVIADPGGAPDRPVRISPSLVTFEAWALATPSTPGSGLTVILPPDYDVAIQGGPLQGPTTTDDGRQAWTSGRLDSPLDFVAGIAAQRPSELAETSRTISLRGTDAAITLRAWPDDPEWRDRVGDLVAGALPILERDIGLGWPFEAPLAIEESLARAGPAEAAVFDVAEGRLVLDYAASDAVILQQLAHAWFNGQLVADRWIADAFALYYAERAATELGIEPPSAELTPELEAAAVPLNAWDPNGTGGDATADAYARAAGLLLAREIGERAGAGALAEVWADGAGGIGAYQPRDGDEASPGPLDWRSLLDLLEDRTGGSFVDLWRAWIARPADDDALDDRASARAHFETTVARAGAWALPRSVREAMRAWQFDLADGLLDAADRVLVAREHLEAEAAALGLTLPDRLQRVFEGEDGFEVAEAEAAAQRGAVAAIHEARDARPATTSPVAALLVILGLVGVDPDAELDAATDALAAGDVGGAFAAATTAEDLWVGAPTVGRNRIVSVTLLAMSVIVLGGLIGWRRRGGVSAAA